jgi:hypothetical protein
VRNFSSPDQIGTVAGRLDALEAERQQLLTQ